MRGPYTNRAASTALALALWSAAGCGPSVAVPTGDGTTSGTAETDLGSTQASTDATVTGTPTTGDSTSEGGDTSEESTGSPGGSSDSTGPALPPPTVLGAWVCHGEGIPFLLRIEAADGADLSGSACAPSDQEGPPESWDDCADVVNHVPIGFAFHVLATFGPYSLEFGFNHDLRTDTLVGFRYEYEPMFEMTEQVCERYPERGG